MGSKPANEDFSLFESIYLAISEKDVSYDSAKAIVELFMDEQYGIVADFLIYLTNDLDEPMTASSVVSLLLQEGDFNDDDPVERAAYFKKIASIFITIADYNEVDVAVNILQHLVTEVHTEYGMDLCCDDVALILGAFTEVSGDAAEFGISGILYGFYSNNKTDYAEELKSLVPSIFGRLLDLNEEVWASFLFRQIMLSEIGNVVKKSKFAEGLVGYILNFMISCGRPDWTAKMISIVSDFSIPYGQAVDLLETIPAKFQAQVKRHLPKNLITR
uniref:Uncharacterized protein n=1 Tax=Polytomella parva TaxID=51329 RepID=A0A7S0YLY9_9CHLO|mmetsp:Transcript_27887/g.51568  ORF Transcript_27887/g.51568 Transcript_27887/m.51568 type:complete len:274 (+) Transcript_27887:148-969(+)|eukprot:CAMPEP_0175081270 /NCGR_PEP_ID=MMETSP0052_2-20121109/26042_1 /TAXON_ID=51329 ORGANISM="Polytomella parva, Strain SAG 63-3" /NCGR_SAMPLE_ID=MMETSP0052_2 /ASSEMBLY_ACC=CAM_ASM_000194 /LENGTH=273 /DNA_ID=CAMNT_0016352207 /DNA_START=108 /DNA_END=929 /DNA_ORIENTATION=+